jgi:hypothetical protein
MKRKNNATDEKSRNRLPFPSPLMGPELGDRRAPHNPELARPSLRDTAWGVPCSVKLRQTKLPLPGELLTSSRVAFRLFTPSCSCIIIVFKGKQ